MLTAFLAWFQSSRPNFNPDWLFVITLVADLVILGSLMGAIL